MNAEKIKELRDYCAHSLDRGRKSAMFGVEEVAALLDEVEALTADAERYRFIRDGKSRGDVDLCICIAHWTEEPVLYSVQAEECADAAIDAARHEPKDAE